ncbi:MAG TPA: TIGR03560 family F420-dependent LLM class oxidoreductase [Myxococcota bacterium]|nr:TIGR03560 family F420-dependent LLM class oxidoreductase [Myxococcota bacterium]
MALELGAHLGQQNLGIREIRALWRRFDEAGLDWISLWDHFYEAPPAGGTQPHFEAVSLLGALATETKRARIGCLVFYPGYRNPAALAKAATTVDHLSGGRFTLGLGAGWHEWEARAYGYDFPPIGTRMDMLDEALRIVRGLLTNERTTFTGTHFSVENASCLPAPVQRRLPIWVGGLGEKRTLRLAARHADGWNAAYVAPAEFARLSRVLDGWCEKEGREPKEIARTVNLSFHLSVAANAAARTEAQLRRQWGPAAERMLSGALLGTPDRAQETLAAYADAGAQAIHVALRAPWDAEALDAYLDEVVPKARALR